MDRPIKTKGFYDMNFVDWNNEWERIIDEYNDEEGQSYD